MIIQLYCVFDSPAAAFLPPMAFQRDGVAVRVFQAAARNPGHDFNRFPADYTLFRVGSFDDATGQVVNLPAPVNLGTALFHMQPDTPPSPQVDLPLKNGSDDSPTITLKGNF